MFNENEKNSIRDELDLIYNAIVSDGDDPIKQLSGYILSEDPIYIPTTDGARNTIRKLNRDEILDELIKCYFK